MKKVIPSEIVQMSLSNISTNDVIQTPPHLECRFCKESQNGPTCVSPLVSPCNCQERIHSYCLIDQMQKNMRGEIMSSKAEKHYTCLKCQKSIRFILQASRHCRSREEIGEFASKRKCFCFWLMLCIVVMVGLLVFVAVIKATQKKIDWASLTNTVLIGISIIVIVLFLVATFFCLTEVMFEEKRLVTLLNSSNKGRRKYSSRLEIEDCS